MNEVSSQVKNDVSEEWEVTGESLEWWRENFSPDIVLHLDAILGQFKKLRDRIALQKAALNAADNLWSFVSADTKDNRSCTELLDAYNLALDAYNLAMEKCRE